MSTKYFIVLSMIVLGLVVAYRYDQYLVARNYVVKADISCDPASESCFVADCSPEDDPACDTTPYKKVTILAAEAPICLEEHTCEGFVCTSPSCTITQCSEDALKDGESCFTNDAGPKDQGATRENSGTAPTDQIAPQ